MLLQIYPDMEKNIVMTGDLDENGQPCKYLYPMIERYAYPLKENSEIRAYREPFDVVVPDSVKSLDGYGIGIDYDLCNYIDFARRKFVRTVYTRDYVIGDEKRSDVLTDCYMTIAPVTEVGSVCTLPEEEDIAGLLSIDSAFVPVEDNGLISIASHADADGTSYQGGEVPFELSMQVKTYQ